MGRVICALGYSGAVFDPHKIEIHLNDVRVVHRGEELVSAVENEAAEVTRQPEFQLAIHLHAGKGSAFRIASDLTPDYVRFNSDYRT